jgi:hypothetical protein
MVYYENHVKLKHTVGKMQSWLLKQMVWKVNQVLKG